MLHGETLAEAAAHAHDLSLREGLVFIHPYDDPGVIAGQGTMALELLEDAPDVEALVIPSAAAGCARAWPRSPRPCAPACRSMASVQGYPAMAQRLAGEPVSVGGPTIAEGIAVRDVGEMPLNILRRCHSGSAAGSWNAPSNRPSRCWRRAPRSSPKARARRASRRC